MGHNFQPMNRMSQHVNKHNFLNFRASEKSRKTRINNEACDIIDSSPHGNCLFNAIKQSDGAMKLCGNHHKLIDCGEMHDNDIRNFVS